MAWMYILKCSDGSFYVGSTKSLQTRIFRHQQGKGAIFTSNRLPVELVYFEEYRNVAEAFAREKQVQNWSHAKREALIQNSFVKLPELAKKKFSK
jgi:putative endonuclease